MVGLGDFPGRGIQSEASAVSADGSVVVGRGSAVGGFKAFRWTATSGMQTVQDLLAAEGVSPAGWTLQYATGVSADGTVIVGIGINPRGETEGWRAVLPLTPVSTDGSPDATTDLTLVASPNPAGSRATLRFTLPADAPVRLSLHDVLGREVAVAADGWRAAGPQEASLDVSALPAGVYVARLAAGARTATQRLTVVR